MSNGTGAQTDIIGRGWQFPVKVNASGGLNWSSGADRIRDAIWIVLGTAPGERVMRPTFGACASGGATKITAPFCVSACVPSLTTLSRRHCAVGPAQYSQ